MEKILVDSYHSAELDDHYVDVYDTSTSGAVNKLVTVQPYGWVLWNTNGSVYFVDSDPNNNCGDSMGVLEISPAANLNFQRRCVNAKLTELLTFYSRHGRRSRVSFKPKARYTVLDCIEFLSNGILYIETNGANNVSASSMPEAQSIYDGLYE